MPHATLLLPLLHSGWGAAPSAAVAAAAEVSLGARLAAPSPAVAAAAKGSLSHAAPAELLPSCPTACCPSLHAGSSPSSASASSSTVASCDALRSSSSPSSDASRTMESAFCSRRPRAGSRNSGADPGVAAPGTPPLLLPALLPLLSTELRLPRRLRPCSKKSREMMPWRAARSAQPSRQSMPPACRQHSLCRRV